MRYVGGGASSTGCLFCRRLAADDDVDALILHRGAHAFVIMNLYPYNTGHTMVVPTAHVATPEEAPTAALEEMARLLPAVTGAARRALGCHGFNVGMNVGAVAGAGIADHLHQHVVPRWEGDANFMPILAATMVLPELIPVTYAKLRAELAREPASRPTTDGGEVVCVVLVRADQDLLVVRGGGGWRLPVATAEATEASWRAATRTLSGLVPGDVDLVGWAGAVRASEGAAGLTFRASDAAQTALAPATARWLAVSDIGETLGDTDVATVRSALANLAPTVSAP